MNTPSRVPANGRGKLTKHGLFILEMHDAGAGVPEIREALKTERGVEVTTQGLRHQIKKLLDRRAVAGSSNLIHAAQVLAAAAAQFGGGQLPQLAQVAPATAATKTPPRAATQTAAASPAVVAPVAAPDSSNPKTTKTPASPAPWERGRKAAIESSLAMSTEELSGIDASPFKSKQSK